MFLGSRPPAGKATLEEVAAVLREAHRVVVLTGAGISVESGVPDFRSPGGLWETFDPFEYATAQAFATHPEKCWALFMELGALMERVRPNPAHQALASLERDGKSVEIVTQNIDGLHQAAGSTRVTEFHGNARTLVCLSCGLRSPSPGATPKVIPRCQRCGRVLKPDVILFGDPIPANVWRQAQAAVEQADVVLVVGTSAEVAPFSELPVLAAGRGLPVIEVNVERTRLSALPTTLLQGKAGQVLPALALAMRAPQGR